MPQRTNQSTPIVQRRGCGQLCTRPLRPSCGLLRFMAMAALVCCLPRTFADVVHIPCSDGDGGFVPTVTITSNRWYLLQQCNRSVTMMPADPSTISNITIQVVGGSALPYLPWNGAGTVSSVSLDISGVVVPRTVPLRNVLWALAGPKLVSLAVSVRDCVLFFEATTSSDRGLLASLSQSAPFLPMKDIEVVVTNTTVHATTIRSTLLVNIYADKTNASDILVVLLDSHVNITLVKDNADEADGYVMFLSTYASKNVSFLMRHTVAVIGVSDAVCYGPITGRGGYPGSACIVIFRSVLSHEAGVFKVESSTVSLRAFGQVIVIGMLVVAPVTLIMNVVDVRLTSMLCTPNGYAQARLAPKAHIVSVEGILGHIDILVANVIANVSVRDDLLLPMLPPNTTNPWMSFVGVAIANSKLGASVNVSVQGSTWWLLLRPVLTTLWMDATGGAFTPPGLASMTITFAMLGLMSSDLSSSLLTVTGCHVTLAEESMYLQQSATNVVTGVLGASLVNLGSVSLRNTMINVSNSTLTTAARFPLWTAGTSGSYFSLSCIVLGTDFGALMAAAIAATQYSAFKDPIAKYMASATASGPSMVRNATIQLTLCTHTRPILVGGGIVRHYGSVVGLQNMTSEGFTILQSMVSSTTSTATASSGGTPSPSTVAAAFAFFDGGALRDTSLSVEASSIASNTTSLVYAVMMDTTAKTSLPLTFSGTSSVTASNTMLYTNSGVPPTSLLDAGPVASVVFTDSSRVSLASLQLIGAPLLLCLNNGTLASPGRVAALSGSMTTVDVGCDVTCGDALVRRPVLCDEDRWMGSLRGNASPKLCLTCSSPSPNATTLPPQLLPPVTPPATQGAAASATIASLVLSVFSSTLPSMAAPAMTGSILRMSSALRLWQRCAAASTTMPTEFDDGGNEATSMSPPIFSDTADNPLGLQVPQMDDLSYAAGTPLGNTVITLAIGFLSHLLASARRTLRHSNTMMSPSPSAHQTWPGAVSRPRPRSLCERVQGAVAGSLPSGGLPETLFIPYTVLLVPTLSAGVALLSSTSRSGATVVLGVATCVVWGGLTCTVTWAILTQLNLASDGVFVLEALAAAPVGDLRSKGQDERHATKDNANAYAQVLLAARWWMEPTYEWSVRMAARPLSHRARWLIERVARPMIEPHRYRWYFVVEWTLAFASGAVLGVATAADGSAACDAAVWGSAGVVALGALEVLLAVALRPFVVRADAAFTIAISSSGAAAVIAGLVDSDDSPTATAFGVTASILQLFSLSMGVLYELLVNGRCGQRFRRHRLRGEVPTHTTAWRRRRSTSRHQHEVLPCVADVQLIDPATTTTRDAHLKDMIDMICRRSRRIRKDARTLTT